MLNKVNFGHFLFNLKRQISSIKNKDLRYRISTLEKMWLEANKGSKKLDESLAKISLSQLEEFGIDVGLIMMDDILADMVKIVFSEVLETSSVKNDPSLLENLFLAYDLKSRERTPIMYTGENQFIAYDDSSYRVFDGNFEVLIEGLKKHSVLPTGPLIMVLFTAMGCKLVLGGAHTVEYYPDYFIKAFSILNETSFNSKMQLLSYGKIRFVDLRNMIDIMSAIRIFDKVGSRNYIQKGLFTLPEDVIDHLNFLSGLDEIPLQYRDILEKVLKNQKSDKPPALVREEERYQEVLKIVATDPETLLKDPSNLKKWIRGTKFEGLHPIRLEVMLENLRLDVEMRLRMLKENINFEKHILGGTLEDEEEGEVIYDGLIIRSNRYPSLLELVYYECKPYKEFENDGILKDHDSKWIWKHFTHQSDSNPIDSLSFSDYKSVFEKLIPSKAISPILSYRTQE